MDDRRVAEVRGQQKPSNDPATTRTTSVRQLLDTADAQTASAATSTALAHPPLGSANAETTPAGAPAAAAARTHQPDATCEGKDGVQGPEKKQQPDGMPHRGVNRGPQNWGGGAWEKGSIGRTITTGGGGDWNGHNLEWQNSAEQNCTKFRHGI